jgi:hypothetical protein
VLSTSLWCPAFLANGRAPSIPIASGAAFASLGQPPPPPDVAADPKPGMIAKIRSPLSVKDHSFAVYARCLLGGTLGFRNSRTVLISPLLERPAFLFPLFGRLTWKYYSEKFAYTAFSEIRPVSRAQGARGPRPDVCRAPLPAPWPALAPRLLASLRRPLRRGDRP